jgi:hypothetical protein
MNLALERTFFASFEVFVAFSFLAIPHLPCEKMYRSLVGATTTVSHQS